eukprot:1282378-Lingulodinium_polyedra.AAC.1
MVFATQAFCKPLRRRTVDPTASLRSICKILHTNAVESTVRRGGGMQNGRVANTVRSCSSL